VIANDRSMQDNPPKPGEGPSKEERETGFYDVMFTGETADGQRSDGVREGRQGSRLRVDLEDDH
jgi:short subunit dehydrogenase-like uncharacterized protein